MSPLVKSLEEEIDSIQGGVSYAIQTRLGLKSLDLHMLPSYEGTTNLQTELSANIAITTWRTIKWKK